MLTSSDCIRRNPHAAIRLSDAESISIDDTVLALDLVAEHSQRSVFQYSIAPTQCTECGAYLSSLVKTVPQRGVDSGKIWRCPFCRHVNNADCDIRSVPESQSSVYDLRIAHTASGGHAATGSRKQTVLNVLLCDSKLIADGENLFSFLVRTLSETTAAESDGSVDQLVAIAFFDKVVRVPRLGSLVSAERPIELDIFDNVSGTFTTAQQILLQQGLHFTTRRQLQTQLYRLQDVLDVITSCVASTGASKKCMHRRFTLAKQSNQSNLHSSEPAVSIQGALHFAHFLSSQLQSSTFHTSITMATSETLSYNPKKPSFSVLSTSSNKPNRHQQGSSVFPATVYHLLQVGSRIMHVPAVLTDWIAETGGFHCTCEHITDSHVVADMRKLFTPRLQARQASLWLPPSSSRKENSNPSSASASSSTPSTCASHLTVWCSDESVRVSVTGPLSPHAPTRHPNKRLGYRQEHLLLPPNSDAVFVQLHLQLAPHPSSSSSFTLSNDSPTESSGNTWTQRAMQYWHTATQGKQSDLPLQHRASTETASSPVPAFSTDSGSVRHTRNVTGTNGEGDKSEETVSVMVSWRIPHCRDYDRLTQWDHSLPRRQSPNATVHMEGEEVVRVWTLTLPLHHFSSSNLSSSQSVPAAYWTTHRLSLPLYRSTSLPSTAVIVNDSVSSAAGEEELNLEASSGDLWMWGVAQRVTSYYEKQLRNLHRQFPKTSNSGGNTAAPQWQQAHQQLVQHCWYVTDCLAIQLMHRLKILEQLLVQASSPSQTHGSDSLASFIPWIRNMFVASFDALWGLYSYRYGPLWAENYVLAKCESDLLRHVFHSSRLSLLSSLSLLRPRLWLMKGSGAISRPLSVSPETTQIISPELALWTVFLTGDRCIVSRLQDALDTDDQTEKKIDNGEEGVTQKHSFASLQASLEESQFPAVKTRLLETAGTPEDRLMFSRLSPRHCDVWQQPPATTISNSPPAHHGNALTEASDREGYSSINDIVSSIQQAYHYTGFISSPSQEQALGNIRKDVELYLLQQGNSSTQETKSLTGIETAQRRFHVRRRLPVTDSPLSFHRYILTHLSQLSHPHAANASTQSVESWTQRTRWKQLLSMGEALSLQDQRPLVSATMDCGIHGNDSSNGGVHPRATMNNVMDPGGLERKKGKETASVQSERMSLQDRGQAASDSNV
jgi:hypothetical protein